MRILSFLMLCLLPLSVMAEDSLPLEITADKALEWNQTNKTYVARGTALAKQGGMSVAADTLTATYAGKDGSTSDISLLTADGHVTLTSGANIATGEKVVYDLTTGQATLSGTRPKIVQNNKNTLEADQIVVWMVNNALDHAEAIGNVVITSGGQIATGDKATYTATTTTSELIGNVKIKQGANLLEGDKASMNMETHISKMIGQNGTNRVKGVFYPGTGKKR